MARRRVAHVRADLGAAARPEVSLIDPSLDDVLPRSAEEAKAIRAAAMADFKAQTPPRRTRLTPRLQAAMEPARHAQ